MKDSATLLKAIAGRDKMDATSAAAPVPDYAGALNGSQSEAISSASQGVRRLTPVECERLQGFPDGWSFSGRKTAAYRQVGNAFPPPVARALGSAVRQALEG